MSQIAEPVIAGLEVVEHFGEASEVLARLMAAPVVVGATENPFLFYFSFCLAVVAVFGR